MDEAFQQAGMTATATGFLLGAAIYAAANRLLATWGAKHRKRSGTQQPSKEDQGGSGVAIAVGAIILSLGYKLLLLWLNEDTQPEAEPSKSE